MKGVRIGLAELESISRLFPVEIPADMQLEDKHDTPEGFIEVLIVSRWKDGAPITVNSLRNRFLECDSGSIAPVFYPQDWYLKEEFANAPIYESQFKSISCEVIPESRGVNPEDLSTALGCPPTMLSAAELAYIFIATYLHSAGQHVLWKHDFIWTNDVDSNGDMVYVGRYIDPLGLSQTGFSIHRHLKLRSCYGVAHVQK